MHQDDGRRADDVYTNTDAVNGQSGKEVADCNATRIQSSELPGTEINHESSHKHNSTDLITYRSVCMFSVAVSDMNE